MRGRSCAAAVLSILLILGATARAAEPTYKGKPAAEWVRLLSDKDDPTRLEAITALVAIGTKEVDAKAIGSQVLPMLEDANPLVRAKACRWVAAADKNPKVVKVAVAIISNPKSPAWACADSAKALEAMGSAAVDAKDAIVAELKTIEDIGFSLQDPDDPRTQEVAALRAALKNITEKKR